MTTSERRLAADALSVVRHRRFVASEECGGYTRVVVRSLDGSTTESTPLLPNALAWAVAATSLQADDLLCAAHAAAKKPQPVVFDIYTDEEA